MTTDIADRCETLAAYRFDAAIPERLAAAAEHQRRQGEALAEAARVIREQRSIIEACRLALEGAGRATHPADAA